MKGEFINSTKGDAIKTKIVGTITFDVSAFGKYIEEGITKALEESADLLVTSAKNVAPVDTGTLKFNIQKFPVTDNTIEVGVPTELIGQGRYGGKIFSHDYPRYVELGTSRTRAQPYLSRAMFENEKQVEKIFEKTLIDALNKG